MEDASEEEIQCSALAAYKREQFDHELRLKRIALSAVNEAARRVRPLPTAEQHKQHTTSHYKARHLASRKARAAGKNRSRPPPPMLFDSEGTLKLAIGLAKETAINRSGELLAVAEDERMTAAAAFAALDARVAQANERRAKHLAALDDGQHSEARVRQPETLAELEQELMWLQRKCEEARVDMKLEEATVRERAQQRGHTVTVAELTADSHVAAARGKYNRFSRRYVALLRLRRPGEKFGPPLEADAPPAEEPQAPVGPTHEGSTFACIREAGTLRLREGGGVDGGDGEGGGGAGGDAATAEKRLEREKRLSRFALRGPLSMYQRALARRRAEEVDERAIEHQHQRDQQQDEQQRQAQRRSRRTKSNIPRNIPGRGWNIPRNFPGRGCARGGSGRRHNEPSSSGQHALARRHSEPPQRPLGGRLAKYGRLGSSGGPCGRPCADLFHRTEPEVGRWRLRLGNEELRGGRLVGTVSSCECP